MPLLRAKQMLLKHSGQKKVTKKTNVCRAVAFLFLVTRQEGTRLLVSARICAPLHSQSRFSHLEACF